MAPPKRVQAPKVVPKRVNVLDPPPPLAEPALALDTGGEDQPVVSTTTTTMPSIATTTTTTTTTTTAAPMGKAERDIPDEFKINYNPREYYPSKVHNDGTSLSSLKIHSHETTTVEALSTSDTLVVVVDQGRFEAPESGMLGEDVDPKRRTLFEFAATVNVKNGKPMENSTALPNLWSKRARSKAAAAASLKAPAATASSSEPADESAAFVPAPKVKRDVHGNMVVDFSSLIHTPQAKAVVPEGLEEARHQITSATYSTKRGSGSTGGVARRWSAEETKEFYNGLRQAGTDFNLLSKLLKDRPRLQVKKKYQLELRANPELVRAALNPGVSVPLDVEHIQQVAGDEAGLIEAAVDKAAVEDGDEDDGAAAPAAPAAPGNGSAQAAKKARKTRKTDDDGALHRKSASSSGPSNARSNAPAAAKPPKPSKPAKASKPAKSSKRDEADAAPAKRQPAPAASEAEVAEALAKRTGAKKALVAAPKLTPRAKPSV